MNPVINFIWTWGSTVCADFIGLAAFLRGGAPEKWGAVVLLASWFISPLVDGHNGWRFGIFIVDIVTFFGYLIIAIRWKRLWSYIAVLSQALAVLTHILALMAVGISSWSYVTAIGIWGAMLPMAALGVGVLTVRRDGGAKGNQRNESR